MMSKWDSEDWMFFWMFGVPLILVASVLPILAIGAIFAGGC